MGLVIARVTIVTAPIKETVTAVYLTSAGFLRPELSCCSESKACRGSLTSLSYRCCSSTFSSSELQTAAKTTVAHHTHERSTQRFLVTSYISPLISISAECDQSEHQSSENDPKTQTARLEPLGWSLTPTNHHATAGSCAFPQICQVGSSHSLNISFHVFCTASVAPLGVLLQRLLDHTLVRHHDPQSPACLRRSCSLLLHLPGGRVPSSPGVTLRSQSAVSLQV